ncbi:MAG: 1-acylglycerol-3-phosphate O-acyltransferase [Plesiomonas sp.]|uniref:1-acylglycerol-3-phosphate O-acyltransferase n=1 Tax=Plesiomonas sp. TaxID=2486279 RepID=UPI003F2BF02C
MLVVFRTLIVVLYALVVSIGGSLYCLFSPRNPRHVYTFGRLFSKLDRILGLRVERRFADNADQFGNCIYIANHQNNYDMVTVSGMVMPRTVTVGKKSLLWIPFFGQLYWLTGNILIDRKNRSKAHDTIAQIVEKIKNRSISVWMFPEGTRSRGRGLLPFKTGAFHAAIAAGVPVVLICASEQTNKVSLHRWNNGEVIVEMLPPIDTTGYSRENVRELADHCHQLMAEKISQLNAEVAARQLP